MPSAASSCLSLTAFHQPNFNKAVAPAHRHLMVWSLPACLQPRASRLVCINILMHSHATRSPGTDSSLSEHSSQSESESSTAILAELQLIAWRHLSQPGVRELL